MNKKEVTNQLKKTLEEDPEFREMYNALSDKEKESMKKRVSESIQLHNLIAGKHSSFVMERIEKTAQLQLRDHILAKGYKKPYGKKAKIYATGRSFVFKVEDYLVAVKPNEYFKKGMDCSYLIMLEIFSEKGKIYADLRHGGKFQIEEGDLPFAAYTGHFFDRYKERLGLTGDRESIVKKFMKTELSASKKGSSLEITNHQVMYNLSNGLGLGVTAGDGILIKTFISENEINSFQERKKESLDEMMRQHDLEDLF